MASFRASDFSFPIAGQGKHESAGDEALVGPGASRFAGAGKCLQMDPKGTTAAKNAWRSIDYMFGRFS